MNEMFVEGFEKTAIFGTVARGAGAAVRGIKNTSGAIARGLGKGVAATTEAAQASKEYLKRNYRAGLEGKNKVSYKAAKKGLNPQKEAPVPKKKSTAKTKEGTTVQKTQPEDIVKTHPFRTGLMAGTAGMGSGLYMGSQPSERTQYQQ